MPDMPENGSLRAVLDRSPYPREHLVRFLSLPTGEERQDLELRAAPDDAPSENANGMPTLFGHFTPFNRWTEIDSFWEGHFLERIAPGAFKKTFREQTPQVLFQHGMDPSVGDKPLGAPEVLREDDEGPYYEVPLLDTTYNRDLVPALEAGLYGASFRFSVMREEYVEEPGVSDYNPMGLPERTIKEVRCAEFGPVTFPAYKEATAGVRSLTDEVLVGRATSDPARLRGLLAYLEQRDQALRPANDTEAHPDGCTGCDHPDCDASEETRDQQQQPPAPATTDAAHERTSEGARRDPAARPTTDYLSPKEHKPSWHL